MRKQVSFYLTIISIFFTIFSCSTEDSEVQNASKSSISTKTMSEKKYGIGTIYSFYSSKYSSHYYSADPIAPQYYVNEGPAFQAITQASSNEGLIPVYRYYSSNYQDHYYTTSPVTPANYVNEGIAFWSGYGAPVYRFYSSKYQDHYLSTNPVAPQYYIKDDGGLGAFSSGQ